MRKNISSLRRFGLALRFTKSSKTLQQYQGWTLFQAMETAKMVSIAGWISGIVGACAMSASVSWGMWVLFFGIILVYPAGLLVFKTKNEPSALPNKIKAVPTLRWSGFKNQEWIPIMIFWGTPAAATLDSGFLFIERWGWNLSAEMAALVWIGQASLAGLILWLAARHADTIRRWRVAISIWQNPSLLWSFAALEPKHLASFWSKKALLLGARPPLGNEDRFKICWRLASAGNVMALNYALKAGFNMDEAGRTSDGWARPILAACEEKQAQTMAWMLAHGASLKRESDIHNLVCVSAASGDEACLQLCLDQGGDPNATEGSRVALEWALSNGHIHCAWRLFRAGASVNRDVWMEKGWSLPSDERGEKARACLTAMQEEVALDHLLASPSHLSAHEQSGRGREAEPQKEWGERRKKVRL